MVATLPANPERSGREIALQLSLGASLGVLKGFGAAEVVHAYTRARDLAHEIADRDRLFNALSGLNAVAFYKGDLRRARDLGEECLALAGELGDSWMLCRASNAMGAGLVHGGEPASAREHLQRAISLVDEATDLAPSHQSDVRHPLVFALAYDSWALWLLGYPDRALRASEEALALGARLGHPHTLAFALHFSSVLRQLRREAGAIQAQAETVIALSAEHGFDLYRALGVIMRGWALAERGDVDHGLAELQRGLADRLETGTQLGRPFVLGLLAGTHARAGQRAEALHVLGEAIALGRERTEHAWEPELLRQKGEVLLADPVCDLDEAERSFREAIARSRGVAMRSWELRAAMSLGRLLVRQGRRGEARDVVVDAYRPFTEGFETPDLLEARAFLDEMAEAGNLARGRTV